MDQSKAVNRQTDPCRSNRLRIDDKRYGRHNAEDCWNDQCERIRYNEQILSIIEGLIDRYGRCQTRNDPMMQKLKRSTV